jgi:hypothetical protein
LVLFTVWIQRLCNVMEATDGRSYFFPPPIFGFPLFFARAKCFTQCLAFCIVPLKTAVLFSPKLFRPCCSCICAATNTCAHTHTYTHIHTRARVAGARPDFTTAVSARQPTGVTATRVNAQRARKRWIPVSRPLYPLLFLLIGDRLFLLIGDRLFFFLSDSSSISFPFYLSVLFPLL